MHGRRKLPPFKIYFKKYFAAWKKTLALKFKVLLQTAIKDFKQH